MEHRCTPIAKWPRPPLIPPPRPPFPAYLMLLTALPPVVRLSIHRLLSLAVRLTNELPASMPPTTDLGKRQVIASSSTSPRRLPMESRALLISLTRLPG